MEVNTYKKIGTRYLSYAVREAINLHLRGQNAGKAVRNPVILPHSKTIKKYFGKSGTTGRLKECPTVIESLFENLQGTKNYCRILADRIDIKSGVQYYQGGLNKKEIQLNLCNIFSIFIFNELYLFT